MDDDRADIERLDEDDEIAPLFQLAGRRPRLPEAEMAPLREQAREVFRRQARLAARRRRFAWSAGASLAATVLLAVAWPLLRRTEGPDARQPVAAFELRTGEVSLSGADASALLAGTVVTTGKVGRAAVRLPAGTSVRIDAGSVVRFDSPRTLTLRRGAVYVDSGAAAAPGAGIEIATACGPVRDIGTQFEARLLGAGGLRVRVREGRVLAGGRQTGAGRELVLRADGSSRSAEVPVYGSDWDWVQRTAPAFVIENASLADFLQWVSRETGLRWRLAGPQADLEHVVLHGSIEGLTAEESLSVVLPGCGYRHRRIGGELLLARIGQ